MINVFYDCYRILYKVYGEKTYLKQAVSDTAIEEKNRALVVKTCYGVLDKDAELCYYLKYLAPKTPKQSIRIILKIAMYSIKYLGKKPYAAADSAVELVKKMGKGGAGGFVNAFLRKFSTAQIPLPDGKTEYLAVKYSYPEFAVKMLAEYYGESKTEKIISAENALTCLSFYGTDGEEYLKNSGAEFEKTPFYNVFTLKNFVRNADYDKGVYTYQALPSVAICVAVEPCENILDCCAAPGGKSVRLSYKCKHVTAWDIHPHRVALIESYVKRMGRENVSAEVRDAKVCDKSLFRKFDAVLCDAPCSGTGVVNDNPDIKLRRTEEDVKSLCTEQRDILSAVCEYVKPGGYLYYSTCSVLPCENMGRISAFLAERKDFKQCAITSPLPSENANGALSFLPHISGGLGFYVAKLVRIK